MRLNKSDMLLYAVTDRQWLDGNSLTTEVEKSLQGGVSFVQLREKGLPFEAFCAEAVEIKSICRKYNVPFVINDDLSVAVHCQADGVHIGQSDLPLTEAREILSSDKIIGVSVQTVEQAVMAEKNGADYLGVGAVFQTSTKPDADIVSFEQLRAICQAVKIPVVAIGGIDEDNVSKLKGSGIDGVAVVSAIFSKENVELASVELLKCVKEIVNE